MNRTLVLVNRAAGGGRAGRFWERLRPQAEQLAPIQVVTPADAEASRRAVLEAVESGCGRVVAVGGDGTAHLAAGVLLGRGAPLTLGIVPAGTGSDLARPLAIPRDPAQALRRALLGPAVAIDAGRCDGERGGFFFVNIASAGVSGMVDETVNAVATRGRTTFLRCTLTALARYRCVNVRVWADGDAWFAGPALLLAVANGTTFGKGMRVAPGAVLDDGLFDVVAVGEVSGLQLARRLPQLYFGKHLGAKPVHFRRAREVRLEPQAPLPLFDVDGETYPSGPVTFRVLPGALRVAGPDLAKPVPPR
ncbi:MAG: diacylglycerol kinase family lipid kinase [Thermoanaerobaculaceae bacterium]|nr:diacylglycerol kinase family lipid kinase [Thermoanaerobaculaceae bacterium]TAM54939.1 MAG: diacylglycerol kinase family lipid kinase [Acidobacteriota bacterium]